MGTHTQTQHASAPTNTYPCVYPDASGRLMGMRQCLKQREPVEPSVHKFRAPSFHRGTENVTTGLSQHGTCPRHESWRACGRGAEGCVCMYPASAST